MKILIKIQEIISQVWKKSIEIFKKSAVESDKNTNEIFDKSILIDWLILILKQMFEKSLLNSDKNSIERFEKSTPEYDKNSKEIF